MRAALLRRCECNFPARLSSGSGKRRPDPNETFEDAKQVADWRVCPNRNDTPVPQAKRQLRVSREKEDRRDRPVTHGSFEAEPIRAHAGADHHEVHGPMIKRRGAVCRRTWRDDFTAEPPKLFGKV
ncbi:hypothetical protein JNW90_32255 [Micromonospora sp. STR1s_5]|nr:hypothetical protein [Micromonospora sp. STR1s_5]MBM0207151.1 hypothetical protein [Micromonospora sp. STR1s_5]